MQVNPSGIAVGADCDHGRTTTRQVVEVAGYMLFGNYDSTITYRSAAPIAPVRTGSTGLSAPTALDAIDGVPTSVRRRIQKRLPESLGFPAKAGDSYPSVLQTLVSASSGRITVSSG